MNIEEIRKLRNAKPFRPFELITRDGGVIKIERSLAIALAPSGRSVAGFDPQGRSFYFPLTELANVRPQRNASRVKRSRKNGR